MNATIEEQGMLKILEHLYALIAKSRKTTATELHDLTGIEKKYIIKLSVNGIIEIERSNNKAIYKWVGLKPNIYMAKKVIEDGAFNINIDCDANEACIGSHRMRLEYSKEQAWLRLDNYTHPAETHGFETVANSLDTDIASKFINECIIKYPVLNQSSHHKKNNHYIPSCNEIKEDLVSFMEYRGPADLQSLIYNTFFNADVKKEINIPFEKFWDLYDKKVGDKNKLEKKWAALSNKDREAVIEYIPKYKEARPDKQFRKDPNTFLNNKSWEDEIVQQTYTKIISSQPPKNDYPLGHFTDQQLWDELKRRGYIGTISKALE